MTVRPAVANTARAAHDVGLAAWLGGAMFGKFALNPSVARISSHAERGAVTTTAWNGYNAVNAAGLGAAAVGWAAARGTEARPDNLNGIEATLSKVKDGLMATAVLSGAVTGVLGARLARQGPEGAVPIESGTRPALETPPAAARLQRAIGTCGNLNILSGIALIAVNGVLAQTSHSHPAKRRALTRTSDPHSAASASPLWIAPVVAAAAAGADQVRRSRG